VVKRILAAAFLYACALHAQRPSRLAGTYALRICASDCSANDSSENLNAGFIVLSDRPLDLKHIPFAARFRIRDVRDDSIRDQPANACFSLAKKRPAKVMAGIIPNAVTRWSVSHDTVDVLLYASPDAFYSLRGMLVKDTLIGVGTESGYIGGFFNNPAGTIQAVRTGPPDISKCFSDSLIAEYAKMPEPTYADYKIGVMLDVRDRAEASGDTALFRLAYHPGGLVTDENGMTYYSIDSIVPAKLKSSAYNRLHPREIVRGHAPRVAADRNIAYIEEYSESIPAGSGLKSPRRRTRRVTIAQASGDQWVILREITINER